MADMNEIEKRRLIMDNIEVRSSNTKMSEEIKAASSNKSKIRQTNHQISKRIEQEVKRGLVKGADPYDNTPGGSKVPKDKLMSLTNGAYTATLLEKILKASDNSQFQNSTLKFQEQALNYMQTISADVKSLVEYLKPKAVEQQEDEDNELKMEMTNMAKALSSLDVEGIAREIGKSIYSKMDSGGYGDLVKTMYQSLKDTIQGGEFSQMVKGMIQNTMLSQLPKEWQQNIQQFRDDPVKLMQLQLNKLGRSDNNVIRDIFGSFIRREKPNTELQEKKVDLSAKAMFDNKFYMSVTKVIPEQLYRIVAALEGHEIRAFDWDKQDYLTATEIWAKAHKNNMAASPEAVQRRVMDIFSYSFEQMAEKPGSGNLRSMFQLNNEGKLDKDQITGHVKFRNNRVKNVLTQMVKSGIDISALQYARPEIILKELDLKWKSDAERGAILQDIYMVQTMLRNIDFEDRSDLISDVSDLREEIHNRVRDNSADFLTAQEMGVIERIMYNPNLTADQKKDLLSATNQRGIHVWGDGVFGESGSGGGTRRGPLPPIFGPSTSTDTEGILNTLNQATPRQLNDRELNDARTLFEDFVAGKTSNRDVKKIIPVSERDKYLAKLNDMYGMGAIDKAQFEHLSTFNSKNDLQGNDAGVFSHGGLKIELAHKLYGILTDAGYTAEAKAAQLGISVQEAKARGYVGDAFELMKVIEITNGEAKINTRKLQQFNMSYLTDENLEFLKKHGRQRQRSVLGTGSIDQQISKSLSGIFGDPKIANKAGMALGGAAGLGVHKLLKSAGVMQDPRFGWILGGVGAGLMTMERSRNFIDNVFGPAGDIKGKNGFTNKEIFMAKAMTQYLPMIGVGGKTAQYIIKATSAFGPLGKAFGLLAGPILGYGVGKAASSLLEKGRDWLFNPDRDKKSKLGKLASFLKDIPGVKKLFALSDDRTEDEVMVDSLKQTLSYFKAKDAELKAKGEPPRYTKQIQILEQSIPQIEKLVRDIKGELSKEGDENQTPNQGVIDSARKQINKIIDDIDKVLGEEGKDIRTRYYDEQMDARDRQNRMRAAADQDYNRIGEEQRERVSEIIGQYYEASDENKASFREFITGEGDSWLDSISDQGLRDEIETLAYRRSLGDDVREDYENWKIRFKRSNPEEYADFLDKISAGERRNKALVDMEEAIVRYLVDELHMGANGESPEQIHEEARRIMMQTINHKSAGRIFKEMFGEQGADILAKLQSKFGSGLDAEDIAKEERLRDFFRAVQIENPDNFTSTEAMEAEYRNGQINRARNAAATSRTYGAARPGSTRGSAVQGNVRGSAARFRNGRPGARGTEPVKMKQMEKLKFASGESLGIAGCSVAAIINALVYMGLDAPEPDTLIGIANKYLTKDGGVTSDFFLEVAKNLGIKASIYNNKENVFTVDVFKQFKVGKDNGLICLLKNQFSAGYHYVTIKSVSGRKLVVDDPETKGLTQTTAAEIVSRVVEIVSLQTIAQTSITEETTMDPTKAGTTLLSGARQTGSSIKQVAKDAIADVASAAINKISGGATKALGKWAGLVEALKNAVFNVRIVDDFTLPLKMGDAEAALAVSRMQAAAASSSGASATKYVQAIKKMMMNKDVQSEMNESDLMQETIINGGLVAGGSTGAGGRGSGTIGNGKPGGTWGDALKQDAKRINEKLGLGTKIKQMLMGGGLAAAAGLHGLASKVTMPMLLTAYDNVKAAQGNLFGEIKEEDKVPQYDEEGNLIKKSKYRDISGSVRKVKDAVALTKGALAMHGLIGKGGNKIIKMASNTKIGQTLAKTAGKGLIGKILKLMRGTLLSVPEWILKQIMKVPSLTRMMGGGNVVGTIADYIVSGITKICKFIGDKLLPKLSAKLAQTLGKSSGGIIKKIIGKIPGGMLLLAVTGLIPAVINGWRKAGEYLNKKRDEEISLGDRILSICAKVMYDCGPEIIMGLFTTVNPWAAIAADVGVAVLRSMLSFNDFISLLTKGIAWAQDPNVKFKGQVTKQEKTNDAITNNAINKLENQDQAAAQKDVDKAEKNAIIVAGDTKNANGIKTENVDQSRGAHVSLDGNIIIPGVFDRPTPLTNGWGSPVNGMPFVTSAFGPRKVKNGSDNHKGIDIRGNLNDTVRAAKDGEVVESNQQWGLVKIKHADGTSSRYLHMNVRYVKKGDKVKKGQPIGGIGNIDGAGRSYSGWKEHLHFEIMKNGNRIDPFIELGLSKKQLKLPENGYGEAESAENIAYVERNQWLNENAKKVVDNRKVAQNTKPKQSTNTEAGGPNPSTSSNNYNSNYTNINNNNNLQLERYVRSLDAKFNQMIDLLSKLVNISQENANNVLSDAMAPARI